MKKTLLTLVAAVALLGSSCADFRVTSPTGYSTSITSVISRQSIEGLVLPDGTKIAKMSQNSEKAGEYIKDTGIDISRGFFLNKMLGRAFDSTDTAKLSDNGVINNKTTADVNKTQIKSTETIKLKELEMEEPMAAAAPVLAPTPTP